MHKPTDEKAHSQIYVVYDRNKKVVSWMAGVVVVSIITTIIVFKFYLPVGEAILYQYSAISILITRIGMALPPVYGLSGCYAPTMSSIFGVCQIPVIVAEAILCACMLHKARIIYINDYGSQILKLLIRDRLVYLLLG